MLSVSYTKTELLHATSQVEPLIFREGESVTLSDISLSTSVQLSSQKIIQALGLALLQHNACLSPIKPEAIYVEEASPLRFRVLQSFELHSASRANWLTPPFNRFAFRNITCIHNLNVISRGDAAVRPLVSSRLPEEELEKIPYQSNDKTERTFMDMLIKTHTDSIIVVHQDKIVYEKYFNGQDPDIPHIQFSLTKSLIGIIVTQLIYDKVINPTASIGEYIPDLKDSGFADASVTEILDMTTGLKYNEEYANPNSDVAIHLIAASYMDQPVDYSREKTIRTFLTTIKKEREHNQVFQYVSANTEVLSWLVENATQLTGCKKTVNELFVERIWSKLGTEQNAFIIKDSADDSSWAGGFTAITRDMARVGQMILNNGKIGEEQLISQEVFEFMRQRDMRPQFAVSGNVELYPAMKGWSYANQFWWTNNEHGAFTGIGINGQLLYIDPKAKMVVAKNSSHTNAVDQWLDWDAFFAIHALSKHLMARED